MAWFASTVPSGGGFFSGTGIDRSFTLQKTLSSISLYYQEQVKGNKPALTHLLAPEGCDRAATLTQFWAAEKDLHEIAALVLPPMRGCSCFLSGSHFKH